MSFIPTKEQIEQQRQEVFGEQPDLNLEVACKLNEGVLRHSDAEKLLFSNAFVNGNESATLFIPASGSGSRMFKFLYDFLENPSEEDQSRVERFINNLPQFAFFELLPFELQEKIKRFDYNIDDLIKTIIGEGGLGLGSLPKGLIPFHRNGRFILNAFQEQVLQGARFKSKAIQFHFTIDESFSTEFSAALASIETLTGQKYKVEKSVQDPETNAIAFDLNTAVFKDENGQIVTRPAGHGSLIKNLSAIESDLIFIKNIDNVQHESISEESIFQQQYMGGLLLQFQNELKVVSTSSNRAKTLAQLNEKYQFLYHGIDILKLTNEEIDAIVYRPIRVCGMVKNDGQPGGGPFWVNDKGVISKQIVEKAQISKTGEQYKKMVQSQYFNPVLMVISPTDIHGQRLDLQNFIDSDKYFIVEKNHKGKTVKFREFPGLWNGGMSNYNTLFVELPSETFSPVKTALDLLSNAHNR
ncbi:MAG: DUF4301 family protein [Lishizhenia sp.]